MDMIDQSIKRSELVSWASGQAETTITLTAMDMAYLGALAALMQANAWLSNESDETITVSEIDHVLLSLAGLGDETMQVAIIKDEKGSATNGGDFSSGAWRKRDLNTELDPENLVTVSNNSVIINVAGVYYVAASAPATEVYYHNVRLLRNGVEVALGDNADCIASHVTTRSRVSWVGSLAVNDVITMEHRCYQTRLTYGFGYASTITSTNIYSVVELFRLGG